MALDVAIISGMLSVFIGGWILADRSYQMIENADILPSMSAYRFGNLGMILGKIFIVGAFTLAALYAKTLKGKKRKEISTFAAIFNVISIIAVLSIYWKPGWYYVFDPAGNLWVAMLLFLGSIVQCICFMSISVKRVK